QRVQDECHAVGPVAVAGAVSDRVLARIGPGARGLQVATGGVAGAVARSVRDAPRVVDQHPGVPERPRLRLARARIGNYGRWTGMPTSVVAPAAAGGAA